MKLMISSIIALALLLSSVQVQASPGEAEGNVTDVIDGDTITIDFARVVRLADVNSPELSDQGGPEAKEYTREQLLGRYVFLDLDNTTGLDKYGRSVAVVYLTDDNGSAGENYNRMIVDAGHAQVTDYRDNEFDPDGWWPPAVQPVPPASGGVYVGSTKSNKYHYPDCRWAKKILPENAVWFSGSEEAQASGYLPCGVCGPV